ncbi:28614_t:CDS:1, partial [Racocetra persica]
TQQKHGDGLQDTAKTRRQDAAETRHWITTGHETTMMDYNRTRNHDDGLPTGHEETQRWITTAL